MARGSSDSTSLALELFLVWYFVVGFLLGNGVPHFVFGSAGKVFRSPFGQKSPPRTNVIWGIANFVVASLIAGALSALNLFSGYALLALLLGFWLTMFMFGARIKHFLSD